MAYDNIKSLIEVAIDSCEAIDIGSFFPKTTCKNTRPASLNKPLFISQDQIPSPHFEKPNQAQPTGRLVHFSIPFVYPTVEDVRQQESETLCHQKAPLSCTQAFEDNFDSMNLTQMLDETRSYNLPSQGPTGPLVDNSSRNPQLEYTSTSSTEDGARKANVVGEDTTLTTGPSKDPENPFMHVAMEAHCSPSAADILRNKSIKFHMDSKSQHCDTTINEHSSLRDRTPQNIDRSSSVTGFFTAKGVSIATPSTAALQRAKGLIADCFKENSREHIEEDLHSVVCAQSALQDSVKTTSPNVDVSTANSFQSSKTSDICHGLPPNVDLSKTHANKNALIAASLVTNERAKPCVRSSDSLQYAKNLPETCVREPVLGPTLASFLSRPVSQSLSSSGPLDSFKSTGFQTGKGVSIPIKSTEALKRAKTIFADCLNEPASEFDKATIHEGSRDWPQISPDKGEASCVSGFLTGKAGSTSATTKTPRQSRGMGAGGSIEPVLVQAAETILPHTGLKPAVSKPTSLKYQVPNASPASLITGFSTGKGAPISLASAEVPRRIRELIRDCLDEPVMDVCQQLTESSVTPPAQIAHEMPPGAKNSFPFAGISNERGLSVAFSSTDVLNHSRPIVKERMHKSSTEAIMLTLGPQRAAENGVVSQLCDRPNKDTSLLTGSPASISSASSDTLRRTRPSLADGADRPDVSTDKQTALQDMDASSLDSKLRLVFQNSLSVDTKTESVLPSNTSPQGPVLSTVSCTDVVGTVIKTSHGCTSNAKRSPLTGPTDPTAGAYTVSGSACFVPEEETDGEIPRKSQSPKFSYEETLAGVFETGSPFPHTSRGSSEGNVTSPSAFKNRALARELQESMAVAKFKSHTTPSPKTARRHAGSRTPVVVSVATSRGQSHKVVREPKSPGLLWRLRHRLPISSAPPGTCCLPAPLSTSSERFVLPDCLELPKDISSWSLSTAGHLLFRLDTSDSVGCPLSYNLGDGVEVIPNESGSAGVEEVGRAFVCSPGVAAGLASHAWVNHHFTQLAWRFGSCAILQPDGLRDSLAKFPVDAQSFLASDGPALLGCWLLHALLLELKYRYDKELEAVERSAVRKILETDDTPAKGMVLCVSQLQPLQNSAYRGRLTDGWYHIDWLPDKALAQLISRGRIRVGTKLVCAGAEAVQRPPELEPQNGDNMNVKDADSHLFGTSSDLVLRLSANSTRIAHPTARLGYASLSMNHITSLRPTPLSSLYADGGPVSSILVLVQRRFQLQFMETRSEDSESERKQRIFRDPRSEEAASRNHEKNCQLAFDKAAGDFSSSPKRSKRLRRSQPTPEFIASLGLDGEALFNAINGAPDPDLAEASLSTVQRDAVLHFKEATMRELLAQTAPKREVTPLLRLHLAGLHPKDIEKRFELSLTLWNPSEEMLSSLKEGAVVQFFRLQVSTTRVSDPFAPAVAVAANARASYTESPASAQLLSLSGGRSTAFRLIPKKAVLKFSSSHRIHGPLSSQPVSDLVEKVYRPRVVHSLADLPKFAPNSSSSAVAGPNINDFSALVVGVYKTSMPSLNPADATSSDLSVVYLAHHAEEDCSTMGVLRRYCLGAVLRPGNKVTFTDVQVRGCCIFRPQHDFAPDSCDLRLVNLNYTAASYTVVAGSSGPGSIRQLRTPCQESSNFTAFMRACADAHFEKSFSRPHISTPAVKSGQLTASRTTSASTPIQRRGGNLQAPSSATTTTTTTVRSLSTLLRGDLVSAASSATPCKPQALETTPSRVPPTPKPYRTRTGLSRPRSARQTPSVTTSTAASALTTVTTVGPTCMRTRLRASQEATESSSTAVMSPGPVYSEPVEQTPVRRAAVVVGCAEVKPQEVPTSPSSPTSPSFLGSSFTAAAAAEALDDLNVSIADLVKTRRRSASLLASPPSALSSQSSYPRTPRSKRKPASRTSSPSVGAV
ncbi:Breast cancer 2, early onset [Sparganum proliferum]